MTIEEGFEGAVRKILQDEDRIWREKANEVMGKPAKIAPYLPHYCREPNKLLGYYDQIALRRGNVFRERVAVFLNKKKERCEEICMVRRVDGTPYEALQDKVDQILRLTSVP